MPPEPSDELDQASLAVELPVKASPAPSGYVDGPPGHRFHHVALARVDVELVRPRQGHEGYEPRELVQPLLGNDLCHPVPETR